MNCLFCQQPIQVGLFSSVTDPSPMCSFCSKGNVSVYFTPYSENEAKDGFKYVHIYGYVDDARYHVRWEALENRSVIISAGPNKAPIMYIPGFPFTPDNIESKLKTYLTFQ